MSDKILTRKGFVSADFLTESYRISGEVALKNQPLVDMLNDKLTGFIRGENVYVSPVHDPATFTAQGGVGNLRKDRIGLVVLAREEDGQSRHSLYQTQTSQPTTFSLFATMPGFEVRGALRQTSLIDIENMLMQSVDRFITIFRATAKVTSNPELQFTGGAILLNRELATLFFVEKIAPGSQ